VPARSAIPNPAASSGFLRRLSALVLIVLTLHPSPCASPEPRTVTGQVAGSPDAPPPAYPKPVQDALRSLKRGLDLYSEGKYLQALGSLPDAERLDGFLLVDYATFWRGWACLKADRAAAAASAFRLTRSRFPDSPLAREAVLGECEALLALGNPAAALALLDGSGIGVDAGVLYHRGLVEEAAGHRQKAEPLYLRVYCDYVNADESELALERLTALSPTFMARAGNLRALLQRAENLLQAGRITDARLLLIRLSGTRPPDAAASQWRKVMLADAERRLGRASKALGILTGISGAEADVQARAIYLKAACYRTLKREPALLQARNLAVRQFPQSPWTERLLYLVATYYDVDNRASEFEAAYGEINTRFPTGAYAQRVSWKLAFCAWTRQRYGEALAGFSRHMQSWPDAESASGCAYWMGRCYEMLGDYLDALLLYQRTRGLANHSYYGRLAQDAADAVAQKGAGVRHAGSNAGLQKALRLLDGMKKVPVEVPQPSGPAAAAIGRARQLVAADLPEQALSELRFASARYRQDKAIPYLAARIHQNGGDYLSSIAALSRAFPSYALLPPSSIPGEVGGLLFPSPYLDLVRKYSVANRLDPAIVLGLIRQESAFMADARSHADARGLMQVLPATGRQLARQAGIKGYATVKLFQPGTNIALGTRQLSSLLEQFAGKIELALAGYNAGARRAMRWKADFGDADMAELVERIPLAETRQYVKQVLTNSAHYRALLGR
jgi:soluble lytic murein transglycosylase